MAIPEEDHLERLPHGVPFRFVTRVDALERGVRAEGRWCVRGDEPFLRGHFPGRPIVPGVLIAEALAQLSGLVGPIHDLSDASAPQVAATASTMLVHVDVRFRKPVAPPVDLELRSRAIRDLGRLTQYEVGAANGGGTIVAGSLVLAAPDGSEAGS
ncbi:MAG: 3-hydroxyacyl-[acyl-carrier-protein] dehydratase FabZ [Phycisphaeraceae bacterium]|nr:3-hydroxyacyl-[acyl-carrier-protein] dehydratase FabZ [Phycisphaeraceae bacterium]